MTQPIQDPPTQEDLDDLAVIANQMYATLALTALTDGHAAKARDLLDRIIPCTYLMTVAQAAQILAVMCKEMHQDQ